MIFEVNERNIRNMKDFAENKLTGFLTSNLTEFSECVFILSAVLKAIDEAKEKLSAD